MNAGISKPFWKTLSEVAGEARLPDFPLGFPDRH